MCDLKGRKVSRERLPSSRALGGEIVQNEPFILTNALGQKLFIEASASPVYESEQVTTAVVVIHDVTPKEQLLTDLRKEISLRQQSEKDLISAQDTLGDRVRSRTAELEHLNEILKDNIAELERTKALMAEQSMLLEAFFKTSLSPLVFLDKDFNFIKVNEAYASTCRKSIRRV